MQSKFKAVRFVCRSGRKLNWNRIDCKRSLYPKHKNFRALAGEGARIFRNINGMIDLCMTRLRPKDRKSTTEIILFYTGEQVADKENYQQKQPFAVGDFEQTRAPSERLYENKDGHFTRAKSARACSGCIKQLSRIPRLSRLDRLDPAG